MTTLAVDENSASRITVTARFDDAVPNPALPEADGSLRLSLSLDFYVPGQPESPYRLLIGSPGDSYGVQAGRVGVGFIDGSGVDLSVSNADMRVTFDPGIFTELPAGSPLQIVAESLVERFRSDSASIGYEEIGSEVCRWPSDDRETARSTPSSVSPESTASQAVSPPPSPNDADGMTESLDSLIGVEGLGEIALYGEFDTPQQNRAILIGASWAIEDYCIQTTSMSSEHCTTAAQEYLREHHLWAEGILATDFNESEIENSFRAGYDVAGSRLGLPKATPAIFDSRPGFGGISTPPPSPPYPGTPLQRGDRDEGPNGPVSLVQKALRTYFPGTAVTGVFDADTERLVENWQTVHGLESDGIVGPATWGALFP